MYAGRHLRSLSWLAWALVAGCESRTTPVAVDASTSSDATPQVDGSSGPDLATRDASSGRDAARPDARPDGGLAGCPPLPPLDGQGCKPEGTRCAYGTSVSKHCGSVHECYLGKWLRVYRTADCTATSACPSAQPAGLCVGGGVAECLYGEKVCVCRHVCSGVRPPPGQEYAWACAVPPPAACPAQVPTDGAACSAAGVSCQYGSCGGSTATCVAGRWKVTVMPPQP